MPGSFGAQIASKRAPNIAGNVGASPLGRWETKCLEIFGPKLPPKQPLILRAILGPTCLEDWQQKHPGFPHTLSACLPRGVCNFAAGWGCADVLQLTLLRLKPYIPMQLIFWLIFTYHSFSWLSRCKRGAFCEYTWFVALPRTRWHIAPQQRGHSVCLPGRSPLGFLGLIPSGIDTV